MLETISFSEDWIKRSFSTFCSSDFRGKLVQPLILSAAGEKIVIFSFIIRFPTFSETISERVVSFLGSEILNYRTEGALSLLHDSRFSCSVRPVRHALREIMGATFLHRFRKYSSMRHTSRQFKKISVRFKSWSEIDFFEPMIFEAAAR